jgi:biopolymer transport protein ExbD
MSRRKKKRHGGGGVQMNLAAMLDMAFQLLSFFILTFKPAPIEGQLSLMLPPPKPATQVQPNPQNPTEGDGPPVVPSLIISVPAGPGGNVAGVSVGLVQAFSGPASKDNLMRLDRRMKELFGVQGTPFEQVLVRVGREVHYSEMMKVVDVCSRQKLESGEPLTKISFTELTE